MKLNFRFCRVNVNVNQMRFNTQKQGVERKRTLRQEIFKGLSYSMIQVSALNKAIVHEQVLLTPCSSCKLRFTYKTLDAYNFGFFLNGHQTFVILATKSTHQTLPARLSFLIKQLIAVMVKLKR